MSCFCCWSMPAVLIITVYPPRNDMWAGDSMRWVELLRYFTAMASASSKILFAWKRLSASQSLSSMQSCQDINFCCSLAHDELPLPPTSVIKAVNFFSLGRPCTQHLDLPDGSSRCLNCAARVHLRETLPSLEENGRLIFYHYWCWRAGGAVPVKTSTGNNFPRKYQRSPKNYYQYWCWILGTFLPFSTGTGNFLFWQRMCGTLGFDCLDPNWPTHFSSSPLSFKNSEFHPSLLPSFPVCFRPSIFPSLLPSLPSLLPFIFLSFLPSLPFLCSSFATSFLHSFLPSFLPSVLASLLPSFLVCFLPSFPPSFLRSFLPSVMIPIHAWRRRRRSWWCRA